jgi:hypothetical protein
MALFQLTMLISSIRISNGVGLHLALCEQGRFVLHFQKTEAYWSTAFSFNILLFILL